MLLYKKLNKNISYTIYLIEETQIAEGFISHTNYNLKLESIFNLNHLNLKWKCVCKRREKLITDQEITAKE